MSHISLSNIRKRLGAANVIEDLSFEVETASLLFA